jgi:YgiT-type zinc finger domain-containing protein
MKNGKSLKCLADNGCAGKLNLKKIDYSLKHNGKTIIVPDVEILECDTCHEQFYPAQASQKIDLYKECSGKLMLRIDPVLHKKLIRLAKENHRSLNQEISFLLNSAAGHV